MSRGQFTWYELNTVDVDAAKAFYTAVCGFGLKEMDSGDPANPYTMWVDSTGTPMGGVMALPARAKAMGAPPNWMSYITVEDVDIAAAWIGDNGGQVLAPPFDTGGGRCSVVTDPQGAVFGLYGSRDTKESEYTTPIPPGRVCWHELMTSDLAGASSWYAELFGWIERETMDMGPGGVYSMYGFKDAPYAFGGMMNKPMADMPSVWLYYLRVSDFDEALAAVTENGGEVINGPMEVPDGSRVAQCRDPQGALFAINGQ